MSESLIWATSVAVVLSTMCLLSLVRRLTAGMEVAGRLRHEPEATRSLSAAGLLLSRPQGWVSARTGKHDRRREAALPALLEGIARSLRAGSSLHQAVEDAAAQALAGSDDLALVAATVSHGSSLSQALDRWAELRPLPGVRLAVAALALSADAGGVSARAVDGVAMTLRQRQTVRAEARALATQARLSAVVMALAPIAFGLVAMAADSRSMRFLFGTPAGLGMLSLGLLLDLCGFAWMSRLTRSVG